MVSEMGRSPKRERRLRSVTMVERSLRARAKSTDRLSRRLRELSEVEDDGEHEADKAVIVGLSLKLRFVPLESGFSHLR